MPFDLTQIMSQAATGSLPDPQATPDVPTPGSAPATSAAPASMASAAPAFDLNAVMAQAASGKLAAPSATPTSAGTATPPTDPGMVANFAAGPNQGIDAALATLPNMANSVANLPIRGLNSLFGTKIPTFDTTIGKDVIAPALTKIGVPNPADVAAPTEADRVARAAGSAIALLPLLAFGGAGLEGAAAPLADAATAALPARLGAAVQSAVPVAQGVGAAVKATPMIRSIAPVVTGAATGQIAADNVPAPYAGLANVAGNLLGGGFAGVGQEAAAAGASKLLRTPGNMGIGPKTTFTAPDGTTIKATSAQANAAAQTLYKAGGEPLRAALEADPLQATADALQARAPSPGKPDPEDIAGQLTAVRTAMAARGNQYEQVPGENPLTSQVAPLPGVQQLRRAVAQSPDEQMGAPAFLARTEQQNTARVGAVQAMQPEQASPQALGEYFVQQLMAHQNAADDTLAQGQAGVRSATASLPAPISEDAAGSAMRDAAQQAKVAQQQSDSRQFWDKVDPDGTLAHSIAPAKDVASVLMGARKVALPPDASPEMAELAQQAQTFAARPDNGEQLHPLEANIMARIAAKPDVVPFRDTQQLMSALGGAKRAVASDVAGGFGSGSRSMVRLRMLEGSLMDSLSDGATNHISAETNAVKAGTVAPADTLAAKLESWADEQPQSLTGSEPRDGVSGVQAGRSASRAPGAVRAEGQGNERPGSAAGNSQSPEGDGGLKPNVTLENAAAFRAARKATAITKQTFNQGPVGDILRAGPNGAPFKIATNAGVARRLFGGGAKAPEDVAAYIKAVGGKPDGVAAARDHVVSEMHRAGALKPDGTLDTTIYDRMMNKPGWKGVMQHFPEVRAQVGTAAKLQRNLDESHAKALDAVKAYQSGVAKRFLGTDPDVAVKKALTGPDSAQNLARIVDAVQGSADATESLKYHVVQHILDRFAAQSRSAAGTDDDARGLIHAQQFRQFLDTNKHPLRRLFGGQGLQNLDAVRASLKASAERAQAVTGSQTNMNKLNAAAHKIGHAAGHPTFLTLIGSMIGEHAGGMLGFSGGEGELAGAVVAPIAGHIINKMRNAGIDTTNKLLSMMMLHPEFARAMLQRVPVGGKIGNGVLNRIGMAAQTAMATSLMGHRQGAMQ